MPAPPPFDGAALVAMLVTFYQPPSAPNLLRALAERPEYFGGGVPVGRGGDKIQLPDGRIIDCIFNVSGLPKDRRWQAIDVTAGGGGDADPFALEPGPLDYVDEGLVILPGGAPSLESIAAGILEPLNGADDVLAGGAATVAALDVGAGMEDNPDASLDEAAAAHAEMRAAIEADNPIDVIDATNNHAGEIESGQTDYVEDPVPPQPVPDPGNPPPKDGNGGGPPPI